MVLDSAASTMDVAKEMVGLDQVSLVGPHCSEPGGVLALHQTNGRGQRARAWYSAPGESLCVTYFVPLSDELNRDAGKIGILAGAAVASALNGLIGSHPVGGACEASASAAPFATKIGLKWPNDLVLAGKKLGGILVEIVANRGKGPIASVTSMALIGVGVNVGLQPFPQDLAAASTSLAIEGMRIESILVLADAIRCSLDRCIDNFTRAGFAATMALWRQYDTTAGRRFRTETVTGPAVGVAVGVDSEGGLMLRTDDGTLLTVLSASTTSEM